jgi:hypothetical protein
MTRAVSVVWHSRGATRQRASSWLFESPRAESSLGGVPKLWTTLLPVALSKARLQPGLRHVELLLAEDLYDDPHQHLDDARRHEL